MNDGQSPSPHIVVIRTEYQMLRDATEDTVATTNEIIEHCHPAPTNHNKDPQTTFISATNKLPALWSSSAIYCLISTCKHLSRQEASDKISLDSAALWTDVCKKLGQHKFHYTPEQCRTKWSLLRRLYYRIQHDYQIKKFEFFKPLHAHFRSTRIKALLQMPKAKRCRQAAPSRKQSSEAMMESDISFGSEVPISEDDFVEARIEPLARSSIDLKIRPGSTSLPEEQLHHDECRKVSDHHALARAQLSCAELHAYMRNFKETIVRHEQKRAERHQEMIQMLCELNERLRAQHDVAIERHNALMERLSSLY